MSLDKFSCAVDLIVERDNRFDRDAYFFIRDALDFTVRRGRQNPAPQGCAPATHVSGQELLDGVRRLALQEFGSMTVVVLEHWRVGSCEDIGAIVFNLIEEGVFGRSRTDSLEDFRGGYDFTAAFIEPYRSRNPRLHAAPVV